MIKPTIGRVVLFNDGLQDQRVPAFICHVHSDTLINVGGFNCYGTPFGRTNVKLCQDDEVCAMNQAEWMPYQKEQAEKAEAEEVTESETGDAAGSDTPPDAPTGEETPETALP